MDKQAVLQIAKALRNLLAMAAAKEKCNWYEVIYRLDQVIEALEYLIKDTGGV